MARRADPCHDRALRIGPEMKTPVMRVGYILTTFPCRTETFAAREMEGMAASGLGITVFAAAGEQHIHTCVEAPDVLYRPSRFSAEALLSTGYLLGRYPLALGRLLCLALKLMAECPREAVSLIGNIHTVAFFAKHFDTRAISHVHAYFLSWPSVIGLALSVATDRPFSISAHARDIFVERGATELKISRAEFVTVCTKQGVKYLQGNLPAKYHNKLYLNYHGIKTALASRVRCERSVSESGDGETVIAVGRLIRKKGFEDLLRAFALVSRKRPGCRLVIVGDGPEHEQLEELTEQLGVDDRVELLGWRSSEKTLLLIRQATVLVAPSLIADDGDRDGLPNVILEAFACGTPVIAARLDSISEAVEHRRTSLLVKPGDIKELASAIDELLNDERLQDRLSQEASETVMERFNLEKNTKRLIRLFVDA